MAKWDHDDLKSKSDLSRYNDMSNAYPEPPSVTQFIEANVGRQARENVVVTNTPRPGDSLHDMVARTAPRTVLGTQVGGDHYTKHAIQPVEYIWANGLGFSEGNVVKYVTRWKDKGGIKDLRKAHHHLALLIEHAEKEEARGVKYGLPSK